MTSNRSKIGILLDDLPDDYQIQIFEFLSLPALTCLADCSRNLRALARDVFGRTFSMKMMCATTVGHRTICLFGDLITNVQLCHSKNDRVYYSIAHLKLRLRLIRQYMPKLLKLKIDINKYSQCITILNDAIFLELGQSVSILDLVRIWDLGCGGRFDYSILNSWINLVVLRVGSNGLELDPILDQLVCPTMKYVYFRGYIADDKSFNNFAQRNKHIISLTLDVSFSEACLSGIRIWTNLEHFGLNYYSKGREHMVERIYNYLATILQLICRT